MATEDKVDEASIGDNQEAPEETVSESAPDTEAGDEQQESPGVLDELLNKKGFKSADDLAKAYQELESQNKKVEMSNAELLKARQSALKDAEIPDLPEDATEKDARNVLDKYIDSKLQPLQEKLEIKELFTEHEDAPQYAKKMAEFIKDNPQARWETAYRHVKFDDLAKEAKQEGRAEAYGNQKAKTTAQVAKGGRSESAPKDLDNMIKDRATSLSEIEKMLPHS